MKNYTSNKSFYLFLGTVFWAATTLIVVVSECRFPGTDVFLFKEAGIQFANHGSLTAKNLNYMPFEQELPYANYTPVYPVCFGIWSKLVGVGLKQSLLFECILRGIRSLLLLILVWPILSQMFLSPEKRAWAHFILVFSFVLSLISTDSDRPDELGVIFGLMSWIILRASRVKSSVFLAAIFLGLCGATSPACGVAFGLGFISYFLFCSKSITGIGLAILGTLLSFFVCTMPIFLKYPGMFTRFMDSAKVSSVTYFQAFCDSKSWDEFLLQSKIILLRYFTPGSKYIFCALVLSIVSVYILTRNKIRSEICFVFSALIYIPVSFLNWGLQPYYLWFSCLPLAILSFAFA